MEPSSFRVGYYRNVLDSNDIAVDQKVTVLVGKNESGKTNLLHALHALNPASSDRDREFPRHDYPRWLQKQHERSGKYQEAKPIEVVFRLAEDDVRDVAAKFGKDVLLDQTFSAYRDYGSESLTHIPPACEPVAAIRHLLDGLHVEGSTDIGPLRDRLTATAGRANSSGSPAVEAEALRRLTDTYGEATSARSAVGEFLRDRMPRFFYFDEYSELPGTTDTEPLINALRSEDSSALDSRQQTALALLRMGFADDDLVSDDYVARKAELQAVGAELTQNVLQYWRQNQYLRLDIDINTAVESRPDGQQVVRSELKLDVMDTRHHFTNSLDARSNGFRWFVSFIAAFTEFEEDSNVIVLLDEPGLNLHARAQADFLQFINERVAGRHQVLFTTHSPFLVDPARLGRVRVVEDAGPDTGAKVTTAGSASKDPDTLFPLQAALGYDIAQNLFVGPDNLVVEGLSDYTYLLVMSDHLKSHDRTGLDDRWRLLPAGGASNIPTFVTLVGPSLDVSVLVDGAQASSQKVRNLMKAGLLDDKRLITPESAAAAKGADIEDLFTDDDYLLLFNKALRRQLKSADIVGNDRIVKRIERNTNPFDHNAPARYLLQNRTGLLPKLSDETLARFEKLMEAINATLASHP
ncbi:MAG: AAA family ATPase [Bryobacterales bacterium]|nr:AAA family ATPase [Bryobacterales bacterium]